MFTARLEVSIGCCLCEDQGLWEHMYSLVLIGCMGPAGLGPAEMFAWTSEQVPQLAASKVRSMAPGLGGVVGSREAGIASSIAAMKAASFACQLHVG